MALRIAEKASLTNVGRQRQSNEDSYLERDPLFAVADGMGGARAGEVASRMAVEAFDSAAKDASPEETLRSVAREANRRIYEMAQGDTEHAGMGTTLTAAMVTGREVAVGHVGDSRLYRLRDGKLERLTEDHSLVEELMRQGRLTPEEAESHPQRSIITRALGPEPDVDVDTWTYPVRAGDLLLLCSDGLTSMVSEERVAEALASSPTLNEAGERLIKEANEAGGRDNITVVLFRLEEVGSDAGADQPTMVGEAPPDTAEPAQAQQPTPAPESRSGASAVAVAPRPARVKRIPPTATVQQGPHPAVRDRRFAKPVALLVSVLAVLFLVGGGGYLATRQLYFIGTNSQGIVTIYRGFPYGLPLGIKLYETDFVSGVPASLVPANRRKQVFDNRLRSQTDAQNFVRALEQGRVSK